MNSDKLTLENKSILVTGGAGFIGSHLIDSLIKEHPKNITVASNFFLGSPKNLAQAKNNFPALKTVRCDVSDREELEEIFKENNFDVVFNLAVIPLPTSLVRPEWTVQKNIDMTLNLCRLQRLGKFKTLIQFSSSEAVGSAKMIPMSEIHTLDPETPYAASKAATDHIALSYHHTFGCDTAIVRPYNQYGPRQNAKKYAGIIPLIIGRMLRGEPVYIYGDGEQTRDFLYVTDTAEAVIEAYKNPQSRGKVINIASGKEVSINHLVRTVAKFLDYSGVIIHKEERIGDVRRHLADITQAKKILGWSPKVSFEEGIKKTVDWYLANPEVFEQ